MKDILTNNNSNDIMSLKVYSIGDKMDSDFKKIKSRINSYNYGKAFIISDFSDLANYETIKKSLQRLLKEGLISRAIRGVYYKTFFSTLLNEYVKPEVNEVAYALARNFNWTIVPNDVIALNYLGLSTQVPNKYQYFSSGPYKKYNIGNIEIEFSHRSSKEILGYSFKTSLVIQSLKSLGPNVGDETIEYLKKHLSSKEKKTLLLETQNTTKWIYEKIKLISIM